MHLVIVFDYSDFHVFARWSYIKCKIVECNLNFCRQYMLIKMLLSVSAVLVEYRKCGLRKVFQFDFKIWTRTL